MQSTPSKLPTVSVKRSNLSEVPQTIELIAKPIPPFSTGLKAAISKPSTGPGSRKNSNATPSTLPGPPKSWTLRSSKRLVFSNTIPSEQKDSKLLETVSKTKTNGTTSVYKPKTISAPISQGAMSLKDRLIEIRGGLTPPRSSNSNRLARKPSLPATAASASLVPRAKAAIESSSEHKLKALTQHFNTSLANWNNIFDAFCIFAQWSLHTNDRLIREASHLRSQMQSHLEERYHLEELLKQHKESQREKEEKWELECQAMTETQATLQAEKAAEIKKVRLLRDADISELQRAYDAQLSEERRTWAARVAESHQKFSRQFDDQQIEYETQIAELQVKNVARVTDLERHLESTRLEYSAEVDRLQTEADELRRKLAEEDKKRDCPELSHQVHSSAPSEASNFAIQDDFVIIQEKPLRTFNFDDMPISMTRSCSTPQSKAVHSTFLSPAPFCPGSVQVNHLLINTPQPQPQPLMSGNDSTMLEEIESLRAVLDLKAAEAADLRQRTMQLEEELTSVKELRKEIKDLQSRNKNLEVLLELRAEDQKQLQDRFQGVLHSHEENIKEKKKLKMDCEALRFKLLDANHKIEQLNASNASEDDSFDMTDSLSVYSDPRTSNVVAMAVSGRSPRPTSATLESSVDLDDRLPAGSFISLNTGPANSCIRLRRGLQYDRSKRRTLATSAELERHSRH